MSSNLLEVRKLKVAFPSPNGPVTAVESISFDVPQGQITAIIGESGSGKSATCLAVMGLLDSAEVRGDIRFAGTATPLSAGERALAPLRGRKIAMIFQDPIGSLNPVRTIGSHIIETLLELCGHMSRAAARRQVNDLLRAVRLPDPEALLSCYPHELSGGMSQRVMIALALAGKPDLLLADEPTTALDVTVQREILELLAHLRDDQGLTIILVTHDIDIARDYADQVLVLRGGDIVENGPTACLLDNPQDAYTRELLANALPLDGWPAELSAHV